MKTEIEYKFLVDKNKLSKDIFEKYGRSELKQGYLSFVPVVRVRTETNIQNPFRESGTFGFLVIKGPGTVSRMEFDYKIPINEAEELFNLCSGLILYKTRYFIPFGMDDLYWEIDFYKDFDLVVAELEVPYKDYKFEKPEWIIEDVSDVKKYSNASLSRNGI